VFRPFKNYRLLRRYQQIILTIARFGFGELVGRLNLSALVKLRLTSRKQEVPQQTRAIRFRLMLESLGPSFIKLGQILSTRPDLLPMDIVGELGNLRDAVTPTPWLTMKKQLHLNADFETLFSEFDPEPVASASIAQVYKARLQSGQQVAVKIIRPGTEKIITGDLAILEHLSGLIQTHIVEARHWNLKAVIEQYRNSVNFELDLCHEGRNADIFRANFADDPTVYVPRIYWEHTRRNILIMEYIEGLPLTEFSRPETDPVVKQELARRGAQAILKQIFVHGFFQADPHPANARILPGNIICFLDFGMFGRLDQEAMEILGRVLHAIVKKDIDRLMKAARDLGVLPDRLNAPPLRVAVLDLLEQYHGIPLKQINVAQMLRDIIHLVNRFQLGVRHDFLFMIKALGTVESVGRSLDPDFDMLSQVEPFVRSLLLKRYNPVEILNHSQRLAEDLVILARETPDHILEILRKIRKGEVRLDFHHQGLERPIAQMNQMSDKIVLGLIIAALIISSAIMAHAKVGPSLYGIPLIGSGGFLLAGVAGLWIIIDILRSMKK